MPTKISPCLWFDHQAEEATRFYTAIFKDSKIIAISRYPEVGQEIHAMMQMKKLDIERLQRAFAG